MSAASAFALFVAAVLAAVAVVVYAAAVRVRRSTAQADPREQELLGALTEEVRRWRAEAEHWRATAQRLQRELDRR